MPNYYRLLGGDDRPFQYTGGDSRLVQILDVLNPAVNAGTILDGPHNDVGLSTEYEGWSSIDFAGDPNRLKQEAKDEWIGGPPLKTQWGFADTSGMFCDSPRRLGQQFGATTSTLRVRCVGAARYPFIRLAPDIDWDYTVRITFYNNGFDYELTGCHDGFPNHEVYLNGQAILTDNHQTVFSLIPPCEGISPRTGAVR